MLVTQSGIVIADSRLQPSNALSPISYALTEIVIEASEVQFLNTLLPMKYTLSGIVIADSRLQPSNALSPILYTLSGIVIEASEVQFLNALLPMLVTPSPITTFLMASLFGSHGAVISLILPVPLMVSKPLLSSTQDTLNSLCLSPQ